MNNPRDDELHDSRQTNLDNEVTSDEDSSGEVTSDRIYQDDLDYRDTDTDPVIEELTDNPAEELGIPEDEYRDELNKYADNGNEVIDDDIREDLEDREEDDDNSTSNR